MEVMNTYVTLPVLDMIFSTKRVVKTEPTISLYD